MSSTENLNERAAQLGERIAALDVEAEVFAGERAALEAEWTRLVDEGVDASAQYASIAALDTASVARSAARQRLAGQLAAVRAELEAIAIAKRDEQLLAAVRAADAAYATAAGAFNPAIDEAAKLLREAVDLIIEASRQVDQAHNRAAQAVAAAGPGLGAHMIDRREALVGRELLGRHGHGAFVRLWHAAHRSHAETAAALAEALPVMDRELSR